MYLWCDVYLYFLLKYYNSEKHFFPLINSSFRLISKYMKSLENGTEKMIIIIGFKDLLEFIFLCHPRLYYITKF